MMYAEFAEPSIAVRRKSERFSLHKASFQSIQMNIDVIWWITVTLIKQSNI